ncbi:MAG: ABC transporter permease, partial [Holophagales bacterium]|nr:ABC transporter permease [Holophagales bacterium]
PRSSSAVEASRATPGFELEPILLAELDTGLLGWEPTRGSQAYRRVEERLSALPGVETVGISSLVPYGSVTISRNMRRLDGDGELEVASLQYVVGEHYFQALGLPVLAGRAFTEAETWSDTGPNVAIIDQPLAEQLWPGEDPIGRFLQAVAPPPADQPPPMEVVGVVAGASHRLTDEDPPPHVYLPFGRHWNASMHLQVRLAESIVGTSAQGAMLRSVREEIRAVEPSLPVLSLRTMVEHRDSSVVMWMVQTGGKVFTALGALALFLALVGIYGVKAFVTSRRTREIGVRLALGATHRGVMGQMMKEGLQLTLAGLATGMLLSYGVAQLLGSMLYQVEPGDPLVFGTAALVLAASALFAAWLPVRRACGIEPTEALRHE